MQWFSQLLAVFTPKIKRKFFDFYILWIKTNVTYTRLEMIARTKYCTTTTASNWFVTLYYKLLPAVRSSSKHGRRWSSLLLYSISMGTALQHCNIVKAEQHPVVIFTMFCSLFQIVISFFERINMHLKGNFLRNAKIAFKFEWINWFLRHWSQCGRFSSAYSFAYNFLSLIHNSPKWLCCMSGESAALQWCINCPLMLKFEGKSPKSTYRHMPGSHSEIIS